MSQEKIKFDFDAVTQENNCHKNLAVQNHQSYELAITKTNIKVAVSNRVKSAKLTKPSMIKVTSNRVEQNI